MHGGSLVIREEIAASGPVRAPAEGEAVPIRARGGVTSSGVDALLRRLIPGRFYSVIRDP
jgi:hypothetical protein